jgi:RNA polymerase sigma-70 factor (ECF subfamily)
VDESTRQATRLWTLAQPAVSSFVSSVVRDFRDRDGVLQEVAVAVIESFESYDSERPFLAWAIGVARNQVGSYLRRRRRDRQVFAQSTVACLEVAFAETFEEERDKLEHLDDCVQLLDDRGRELCELRYQRGLKPAAISESIGMTGTSVRKALQRIREQLRNCVERKTLAGGA